MKLPHALVFVGILWLSACAHYDPIAVDAVIPPPSDVTGIEILLPNAPGFRLSGGSVESVVSFLRQNGNWAPAAGAGSDRGQPTASGYVIVIERRSGPAQRVSVQGRDLRCGAYRCRLSSRASEALDHECGVEPVHLSPLHAAG